MHNDTHNQCKTKKRCVAFIGTVGVPNCYGGFESFLEAICPTMVSIGFDVFVTCDANKYPDKEKMWKGVTRIFVRTSANGAMSVLHDLYAFFKVINLSRVVVFLGVSGGIFFPLFRLVALGYNRKIIVNVDGVEWRRGKFSFFKKLFLRLSDAMAQTFSHKIVYDNRALRPYILRHCRHKAYFIPYSGDHAILTPKDGIHSGSYGLAICRIEPENNCELILRAAVDAGEQLIFVGNWHASEYSRKLYNKYAAFPSLDLRDSIYNSEVIAKLRTNCKYYVHGHSVGGTNPSLVEMLYTEKPIFTFDCVFNRLTARASVNYFSNETDLINLMNMSEHIYLNRGKIRKNYSTTEICKSYTNLFDIT